MGSIEDRYAYDTWHANREEKLNRMESTAIKQVQQPELYLAADVEPYQKGGWKTVVKASIRVFDGDAAAMYIQLESMLQSGLAIAHNAITAHEDQIKPAPPFMEEPNEHV